MPNLNLLLSSMENDDEKMDLMGELFNKIEEQVRQILLFGPSNTPQTERAAFIYHDSRKRKFFPAQYRKVELEALPAVIANSFYYAEHECGAAFDLQESMRAAFLYGTGTCECFSAVGVYLLAKEYDVKLSIETIFSNESHTYIRLHTQPEYIMDFWSSMLCTYSDNATWNEILGDTYPRSKEARYQTDTTLNSTQLLEIGAQVFTEGNTTRRVALIEAVNEKMDKILEQYSVQRDQNPEHNVQIRRITG